MKKFYICIIFFAHVFLINTSNSDKNRNLKEFIASIFEESYNNARLFKAGSIQHSVSFISKKKLKEMIEQEQHKMKENIRQEKRIEIYKKYLASRMKNSFATDFLTMRY